MFGIWNDDDLEILNYWYVLLDNFETPASEFYDAIEHDLAAREFVGLEISRIEYSEGGAISAQRQYLRLRRERIIFDICAAPYGTAWFFSCRFARYQVVVYGWEILILLLTLAAVIWFYAILFGLILGTILFVASLSSLLLLMRNTVALGLMDVDAALVQIPVIGAMYEIFLRRPTYFNEDTHHACVQIVDAIVRARIEELGAAIKRPIVFQQPTPTPRPPSILRRLAIFLGLRK